MNKNDDNTIREVKRGPSLLIEAIKVMRRTELLTAINSKLFADSRPMTADQRRAMNIAFNKSLSTKPSTPIDL